MIAERRHRKAPITIVCHGQVFRKTFRCRFCNARDTSRELLRQHERQHESANRWIKMQRRFVLFATGREDHANDQYRYKRGVMAEGIRLANGGRRKKA